MANTTRAQRIYESLWRHLGASLLAFGLSYAAASWAIDSGRLTAYFLSIVLAIFAINQLGIAIKKGYERKR